jgi:hypothetical protein
MWMPRTVMASTRAPALPLDPVRVTVAVAPPGWLRRLPRGLSLAFISVLIPGQAERWL